jgi:hypothetical protein
LGSRIAAAFFVLIVSGENALAEVCDKTFPEGNGQYIDGTGFHWMLWLQGYRPVPLFIVIALLFLSFVVMRMRLRLLLLLLCSFMAAWSMSINGLTPLLYINSLDWGPIDEGCVSPWLLFGEPLIYGCIAVFALVACWKNVRVGSRPELR